MDIYILEHARVENLELCMVVAIHQCHTSDTESKMKTKSRDR